MSIEEEFFKTFGIEKRCIKPKDCVRKGICKGAVTCDFYTYPEITDRILLELICNYFNNNNNAELGFVLNVKELKYKILYWAIYFISHPNDEFTREDFIKYVQSLFKGGE